MIFRNKLPLPFGVLFMVVKLKAARTCSPGPCAPVTALVRPIEHGRARDAPSIRQSFPQSSEIACGGAEDTVPVTLEPILLPFGDQHLLLDLRIPPVQPRNGGRAEDGLVGLDTVVDLEDVVVQCRVPEAVR